ncbi:GNAT family N-acetyltransferase [Kitasatospora sp. NPDC001527]|uniref:GNAT family N-acetyltransferase n=1 Tax=Kitasatospora sp. NPDC001527 TaxID=3154519 RepID=UPI003320B769
MTTTSLPPAGLALRPATPDDAPAVRDLLNRVDLLEIGRAETELHEVRADLEHPGTDLSRDSWLLFDGEELVGYGLVRDRSGGERIDLDQYVLPPYQAEALHLFALMEHRAAEWAAANGASRAVLHLLLNTRPTLDTPAIRRRGWERVRRYHVMARRVGPRSDPAPVPPPGVTLRDCRSEEDRRTAHRLEEEAFAGHFDHHPRGFEQWWRDIDGARLDWSLTWIATLEGVGDAAVLRTRDDRAVHGWADRLGVLPAARGRGVGGHLLRHFFAHYAALGRDRVALGVDTANATGALALYEAHGMTTDFAVDTWELVLPVPEVLPAPPVFGA